jgi:hypothetical protein
MAQETLLESPVGVPLDPEILPSPAIVEVRSKKTYKCRTCQKDFSRQEHRLRHERSRKSLSLDLQISERLRLYQIHVNAHIFAGTVSDVIHDVTLSLAMKRVSIERSSLTASVPLIRSPPHNLLDRNLATQIRGHLQRQR